MNQQPSQGIGRAGLGATFEADEARKSNLMEKRKAQTKPSFFNSARKFRWRRY